ncbi:MAG: hypothetical protein ACP5R4_03620 [Armatimonadota bacterium]
MPSDLPIKRLLTMAAVTAVLLFSGTALAQSGGLLDITLSSDKSQFNPGEVVTFQATVRNLASAGGSVETLFLTATYQDPSTGRLLFAASNPVELKRAVWRATALPLKIVLGTLLAVVPGSFTLDGTAVTPNFDEEGNPVVLVPNIEPGQTRVVRWKCTVN